MIQFIEQYSITKGFGRKFNYKVSARQELIALGMCNIAGSFYGGWPVCGSFSRSAVNSMSGAQTPLAGMTILQIMPQHSSKNNNNSNNNNNNMFL